VTDLDLHGVAALLHRSYAWVQRNWRDLDGFPPPFVGGQPGGRPWWRAVDIEAYKAGQRWPSTPTTVDNLAQREPRPAVANDPKPHPPAHGVAALLRAAGGR